MAAFHVHGEHYALIAASVGASSVSSRSGTLAGSMLPFVLRRLGFDPASVAAPFVATLVDVTDLIIYAAVANLVLGGMLL